MSRTLGTRAPAKINLTLHVLGRRADGYHELESLVSFAGTGDALSLEPGEALGLVVNGPGADAAGEGDDNLVLRAARGLQERVPGLRTGTFRLTKRLPVAAGLGGGSSDAAAALRLLARLNGLSLDDRAIYEAARVTGADVPVCLHPRARMMRGIGERLGPALNLPRLFAVLVNPRLPVPTAAVFKALALAAGAPMRASDHPAVEGEGSPTAVLDCVRACRNDLEWPAIKVAPMIAEALATLRAVDACRLARMSGSGATVFGLFDDCEAAASAAKAVLRLKPGWWVKATSLR